MKNQILISTLSFLVLSCGIDNSQNQLGESLRNAITTTTPGQVKSQMIRSAGDVSSEASIQEATRKEKSWLLPTGLFSSFEDGPSTQFVSEQTLLKSQIEHSFTDCGHDFIDDFKNTEKRIIDCSNKSTQLNLVSTWRSTLNGVAGESDWNLVSYNEAKKASIWQDVNTNLLWSDRLEQTYTWNKIKVLDPCKHLDSESSYKIKNTNIIWRLPTRGDFLQADLDGARAVLASLDQDFWSLSPYDDEKAWSIDQQTGILSISDTNETKAVRCVGVFIN